MLAPLPSPPLDENPPFAIRRVAGANVTTVSEGRGGSPEDVPDEDVAVFSNRGKLFVIRAEAATSGKLHEPDGEKSNKVHEVAFPSANNRSRPLAKALRACIAV